MSNLHFKKEQKDEVTPLFYKNDSTFFLSQKLVKHAKKLYFKTIYSVHFSLLVKKEN